MDDARLDLFGGGWSYMILARNSITISHVRDIVSSTWYYKLQASTASMPAKPTAATPSGWTTTEPSYTEGSTNSLYVTQKTTFSDGSFEYSDVSLSSSYEAAKAAYNKSVAAQETANAAQESIDGLEIGGRNLVYNSATMPAITNGLKGWRASGGTVTHVELTDPPIHNLTGAIRVTNTGSTVARIGTAQDKIANKFNAGERYTLSCWVRCSEELNAFLRAIWITSSQGTSNSPNITVGTEWTYIKCENSLLKGSQAASYSAGSVYVQDVPPDGWFEVCGMKVEKGGKATDWTPAPEDVDGAIKSVQSGVDALQPELIVGTHGTTATASWTGTSSVLTEIKAGTRIQFKLSSAGASNVTLNLTLKGGGTTGAKPVYYLNTTRLGTQYGINAVVDLIYDGAAWRVLNPYTNSNTVGAYAGAVKAGANGVKNYSLVMRDTEDTWVALTTTAGTGASKARYTGGLYPDKVLYMGSNAVYASGATTGTCYEALALNLNYSTNSNSGLTAGRAVYLVGELHSDGLFYLDATWWTQTVPTAEDGKTYIYLGLAYSTSNIYLVPENTLYQFYGGKFRRLSEVEEMKAARTATNYLASDTTGIMVADMSGGQQYTPSNVPSGVKNAFVDNDSFDVRDGRDVLASFGETAVLGKQDGVHAVVSPQDMKLLHGDIPFFHVRSFNTYEGGTAKSSVFTTLTAARTTVNFVSHAVSIESCTYTDNGESLPMPALSADGYSCTFATSPQLNREFVVVCYTDELTYEMTLGTRATDSGYNHGSYSVCIGRSNVARYQYSVAIGHGVRALRTGQVVFGNFNEPDAAGSAVKYMFLIGNGTSDSKRANAFAITQDNDAHIALDTAASSGTVDADLYDAITALGWENDVIV